MLESRFFQSIVASALLSVLEELRLLYSFRFSTFGGWGIEFDLVVTYTPLPLLLALGSLLHLETGASISMAFVAMNRGSIPEQRYLWTAYDTGIVALLFVEGIAAFVQSIDLE